VTTPAETLRDRFEHAMTFVDFAAGAKANTDLWKKIYEHAEVRPDIVARASALGGAWHLLVLAEDWCGDAVNTIPPLARLTEVAPNISLRVLARDQNLDLMDAHLTNGRSRSIPVVIFLDASYEERGWWGPRPESLQAWALNEGVALPKEERYKALRTWYARDRGHTTLDEILTAIERVRTPAPQATGI
jgi:Thioredoxin